ncbi:hypothetical protein F3Y22_tig00110384pilonHSYRG00942 [Hibiscus syriacus]|uniref:Uncharacterized protein n=1 Tax=Hibiscus syriacus TaxID=106335 RepID=A0A6A3AS44_HIBSY|nr:hypothetical protein F3Y22_tig00110384pilonHSYRG00942 [Hibiscus syriacus]
MHHLDFLTGSELRKLLGAEDLATTDRCWLETLHSFAFLCLVRDIESNTMTKDFDPKASSYTDPCSINQSYKEKKRRNISFSDIGIIAGVQEDHSNEAAKDSTTPEESSFVNLEHSDSDCPLTAGNNTETEKYSMA